MIPRDAPSIGVITRYIVSLVIAGSQWKDELRIAAVSIEVGGGGT